MRRAAIRARQWQRQISSSSLAQRNVPRRFRRPFTLESPLAAVPVNHTTARSRQDDDFLRAVFDDPSTWNEFSRVPLGRNVGLFRNAYLQDRDGFLKFAEVSLRRARGIVEKVLRASSIEEYRAIVRHLDRLSDILCRVLDMSDFVRVTHPDSRTQQRASQAWDRVYQYMNELNTMTGLHDQLVKAMANPDVTAAWSEEEKAVAEVLKLDFTKSAVNLPKEYRDRFVALSSEISTVGSMFVQYMVPDQELLVLPSSHFWGMDPVQARLLTRDGNVHLPTLSGQAALALRTVSRPETRKQIYYASRTASHRSVKRLEYLMKLRSEIASISGFESYAHLALRDRMMARSPEAVDRFLRALADSNRPKAQREVADLLAVKMRHEPSATTLEPWDKDYYSELIRRPMRAAERSSGDSLSCYFSIGVVMQGLSRLFSQLYGIRFVAKEPLPGETWDPEVRRLDVVSDTDERVAVLYCDLFYRPNKSPNPAHFTLRCSREISEAEMAEVWSEVEQDGDRAMFAGRDYAANDGMEFSRHGKTVKQLPTIALVCDFTPMASNGSEPALLSFFQLETLFHEMGHAIHSILARTSFQNVSGTRCATDLAELPSTLMEYFAADPSVLSLFARHYRTGAPLPYELVAQKIRQARRFEASDTENQIILAMLDQALHSPKAATTTFDSTEIFHSIQRQFSSGPPDPPGTRWQGFFGHLSGYGSTYYSYLFDRVLAQRVWDVVFSSGKKGAALDRKNGERLKENLLKWGGGRDPWRCLSDVLQDERLADGGEEAMALVGSWGAGTQS